MSIPLEDRFEDIVGKAQRGLRIDDATLAAQAGLSTADLKALKANRGPREGVKTVASALRLAPGALLDSYDQSWRPADVKLEGLAQFNSELLDMTVNAYVAFDPESREAAIFDTGADATELLDFVRKERLRVKRIFLTHTHQDHVAALDEIVKETGAPVSAPADEPLPHTEPVREGVQFDVGRLKVRALLTNGHSPGGTTYVTEGLAAPVAVVGDSLFAGSMGGAPNHYEQALRNNSEKILTLPDNTVLCPGHGPMSTVREEKAHNPFFARA
jgi:glyoxylase-like metal-dependent hydrolase (beta-lactamase superfamily II)